MKIVWLLWSMQYQKDLDEREERLEIRSFFEWSLPNRLFVVKHDFKKEYSLLRIIHNIIQLFIKTLSKYIENK